MVDEQLFFNEDGTHVSVSNGYDTAGASRHSLSLLELNSIVRDVVEGEVNSFYWVVAELLDVREYNGHCFMELVQKLPDSNTPVARAKATCWRGIWQIVAPKFQHVTGQPLQTGQKVMLKVHAQFHVNYGFSWIVDDIDAAYTLGDLARRRREVVRRLKAEGVFELQKGLRLPLFAQRIAVISSATAAGYGDFCHQLDNNEYGFHFSYTLFPAVMQGEQIENSIISALNAINESSDRFDCVVIIRGGGATSDLSGFDTLALGENVANFPLPVITGIGHERDESILDMISFLSVKTPTAAAVFLIENLFDVARRIDSARQAMRQYAERRILEERRRLALSADRIPSLVTAACLRRKALLDSLNSRMLSSVSITLQNNRHALDSLNSRMRSAVSITLQDNRHALDSLNSRMRSAVSITLQDNRHALDSLNSRMRSSVSITLQDNRHALDSLNSRMRSAVSITLQDNRHALDSLNSRMRSVAEVFVNDRQVQLSSLIDKITSLATKTVGNGRHRIGMAAVRIPSAARSMTACRRSRLQIIEATLKGYDPVNILRRGYSITLKDGHVVKDAAMLSPGDVIETKVYKGTVRSTVGSNKK